MNTQPYSLEWTVQEYAREAEKKGLPTPDPHVDGGNGKKTIVYNTKKEKRKGDTKKKRRKEKEKERTRAKRLKKYNRKRKEFSILSHNIRACPRILFVYVYAYNSFFLTL